jgi:hypothetical protein
LGREPLWGAPEPISYRRKYPPFKSRYAPRLPTIPIPDLTARTCPILSPVMAKQVTREQAERKQRQAVTLMERIGDSDRADEFDGMSVEEYAEHRGLQIANPRQTGRKTKMATKNELQEQLDSIGEVLNGAYTPEASREELAEAVGQALDIINGDDEDDDSSDEDDDDSTDEDSDDLD